MKFISATTAIVVLVFSTLSFCHSAAFSQKSFARRQICNDSSLQATRRFIKMDSESHDYFRTNQGKELLKQLNMSFSARNKMHFKSIQRTPVVASNELHASVLQAETSHGMPWSTSIDSEYKEQDLFYMPFWRWQLQFMKEHLTNLKAVPVHTKSGKDLSYVENSAQKMRMHTSQFTSNEYKLIRLTVLDAGARTQVFTSLWYPDPSYNLPVLGVDLLQFQKKKHLCVVDFQPIQQTEQEHDQLYENKLQTIRMRFPTLQGTMTNRFYDHNQFFSNQMLYARHDATNAATASSSSGPKSAEQLVYGDLFPAYQEYVRTHVQLVQSTTPNPDQVANVLERHRFYDNYSSVRDPAHALLARNFGREFADDYVYDILFPMSDRPQ